MRKYSLPVIFLFIVTLFLQSCEATADSPPETSKGSAPAVEENDRLLGAYYYGFYDEDPEYKMEVIRKHVPKFKNQNI
jgi:hypothetical protein